MYVDEPSLSNVFWPVRLNEETPEKAKAVTLWLNSTLGLLSMLFFREETRGPWIGFKKPVLGKLPVLDPGALAPDRLADLARAFDRLSGKTLGPISSLGSDPVRVEIDDAVSAAAGLPSLAPLRTMLAREPLLSLASLHAKMISGV